MNNLRQDETDVNFIDIKPGDIKTADASTRAELDANRRAWEKARRASDYVKKTYPQDARLIEALETILHHLEKRI